MKYHNNGFVDECNNVD